MIPKDRKYTESHEWIKVENGLAIVGITDHAQSELGDITFVELAEVDEKKQAGEECGEIESVKAASDINAPVSGVIAEVNPELEQKPELVNQAPFEAGWLFKMKDFDEAGLSGLMDAAAYQTMIEGGG